MKPSYGAKHLSNLASCNRRTVLRGIAGSLAPAALIASADAFVNATRGVTVAAAESDGTQHELTHRTVSVNGLRLHIAESGQGPLVVLCHGFPECWYSWRHQLRALAEAGFHAVAPDMRGFGQTDAPEDIAEYTIGHNVADMVQFDSDENHSSRRWCCGGRIRARCRSQRADTPLRDRLIAMIKPGKGFLEDKTYKRAVAIAVV
jgi:predicted alpha/beta-fold hydrolase